MLHGDAYNWKLFAVGGVWRGNRSTPQHETVKIKNECNMHVRIRLNLKSGVGIDHPVYYFFYSYILLLLI